MRTVIESHGSENCDQTASHGSLFPFESEPLIKLLKKKKMILTNQTVPSFGLTERVDAREWNLMTFPTLVR